MFDVFHVCWNLADPISKKYDWFNTQSQLYIYFFIYPCPTGCFKNYYFLICKWLNVPWIVKKKKSTCKLLATVGNISLLHCCAKTMAIFNFGQFEGYRHYMKIKTKTKNFVPLTKWGYMYLQMYTNFDFFYNHFSLGVIVIPTNFTIIIQGYFTGTGAI